MTSTRPNGNNQRMNAALLALGLMGLIFGLAGCVSYTNVPVPESAPAFKSANHAQSIAVVARALEAVIGDHPEADASGRFAINLPAGTSPGSFDKIVAELPDGATMPIQGMDEDIPVYHIGRIWIRASDAKVDVIYPLTGADGQRRNQNVTVWLSGGVRSWRVHRLQRWTPGAIATPPIYVPIAEDEEADDDTDSIHEDHDDGEEPEDRDDHGDANDSDGVESDG